LEIFLSVLNAGDKKGLKEKKEGVDLSGAREDNETV